MSSEEVGISRGKAIFVRVDIDRRVFCPAPLLTQGRG